MSNAKHQTLEFQEPQDQGLGLFSLNCSKKGEANTTPREAWVLKREGTTKLTGGRRSVSGQPWNGTQNTEYTHSLPNRCRRWVLPFSLDRALTHSKLRAHSPKPVILKAHWSFCFVFFLPTLAPYCFEHSIVQAASRKHCPFPEALVS